MIDWDAIETVLLDLDGTLLDLHFDNFFWLNYLPLCYAAHHQIGLDEATRELYGRFDATRGTLQWYCLEYWSRELALDIRRLKGEVRYLIRERPHARRFLDYLGNREKKRILITNAHPKSLELKLDVTGIDDLLDEVISSHRYNAPKEHPDFWTRLQQELGLDFSRCLFIDDSEIILHTAQRLGVGQVLGILHPDTECAPGSVMDVPCIHHFDEVLPPLKAETAKERAPS